MKPIIVVGGLAAFFGIAAALLVAVVIFQYLGWHASNEMLDKMALLRPGQKLAEVKSRLGGQMRMEDKLEIVIEFGSIKDAQFCRGKRLYWFYASTPPCRAIEVYTDANDAIIFATWQGL
jgi:hypothetical protein